MRTPKVPGKYILLIPIMMVMLGCNQPYSQSPSVTNTPIFPTSLFATSIGQTPSMGNIEAFGTGTALALTGTPLVVSAQTQGPAGGITATPSPPGTLIPVSGPPDPAYDLEEAAIQKLPKASYQYIVPVTLKLNQTFLVELHLSRALSGSQLSTEIVTENSLATSTSEAGTLVAPGGPAVKLGGDEVEVTPLMQAKLFSENPGAFEIQELHDNPIQVVDATSTVKWQWVIKARQGGLQNLIFVIYQQAKTNDEAHWHMLETERKVVQVNVPFDQRLGSLGWGWVASLVLILAAIPALWRLVGRRKERSRYKRNDGSRRATREGQWTARDEEPGNLFISYRRSDSADIAGRIYDRLVEEFGRAPIFKDVDSIPLGTDFKQYLDRKVGECKVLLVIIGDRWLEATDAAEKKRLEDPDDFVRVEIESALEKEIPVIPLLVRGAQMPVEESLPPSLRKLVYKNGIQIRPDPDFHHDMDRLIAALANYI